MFHFDFEFPFPTPNIKKIIYSVSFSWYQDDKVAIYTQLPGKIISSSFSLFFLLVNIYSKIIESMGLLYYPYRV